MIFISVVNKENLLYLHFLLNWFCFPTLSCSYWSYGSNLFTNRLHMEVVSVCYVTEHWPTVLQWLKDWMNNLEICSPEMATILRSSRSVCSTSLYCLKADSSFWYSHLIALSGSVSIRVLGKFCCLLCLQQFVFSRRMIFCL